MSTPYRLLLPRQLHTEVVQQAQTELPNECCGLLAGRLETDEAGLVGRVTHRFPLVNAAASPREFLSEPRSMLAAEKARRHAGLDFLAVYHSHPSSRPVPSATDLARNYSPDVMNVIISLEKDAPQMRGWWLDKDDFTEGEVIVTDP